MISLTKRKLDQYLTKMHDDWRTSNSFDFPVLIIALALAFMALGMYMIGGLHVGFYSVHNVAHTTLPAQAWENITFLGDTITALAIVLLFTHRFPSITLAVILSAVVGTLAIHSVKNLFSLPRPPAVLDAQTFSILGPAYKAGSLPSGHTATAFILAGLLTRCLSHTWKKLLLLSVAAVIGWSRVAVGVHWPVDIVLGASIGLFSAWAGLTLSDRLKLTANAFTALSAIMLACAIYLIGYDGGFVNTAQTAQIIGVSATLYWLVCWSVYFGNSQKTLQAA